MYETLFFVNDIIVGVVGVAFGLQLIYLLLFFLPAKKYKKACRKHRFALFVCARNEEGVIGDTVKNLLAQDYPKQLFDVFVVAHNCTDRTAEIAREAGATVFEFNDDHPDRRRVAYALKHFMEKMLAEYDVYDSYIRFDADNKPAANYVDLMNDAFDAGAKIAGGYKHSSNLTDNIYSKISGLWYIRDSRFNCQVRSFFGLGQMPSGGGMMISAEIIRKNRTFEQSGYCEDADFILAELLKGNRAAYVKEAVNYEEQPATFSDTFKRNMRMGRGLWFTFWRYGVLCLFKFLWSCVKLKPKYTYLDMFITELFIPIALFLVLWIPAFYGFALVYTGINRYPGQFYHLIYMIWIILIFAFIIPFIMQAFFVWMLERKRINAPFKKLLSGILLFPLFMVFYAAGIVLGILFRSKWKQIKRKEKPCGQ